MRVGGSDWLAVPPQIPSDLASQQEGKHRGSEREAPTKTQFKCERSMTAITTQQEVKEWHFHVYFWATTNYRTGELHHNVAEAQALRDKLVAQVASDPSFVAVCNGISGEQVPGLVGQPPPFNMKPVGPHPQGSFETWAPIESFARVLSWFTLHRGSLSVLVHPLTCHEKKDHSTHAMWLGDAWVIDLDALRDDLLEPPAQYPELGLGYHRK